MRKIKCINEDWIFEKEGQCSTVNLPHTWNAIDGQDGGDDYYRGVCVYRKELARSEMETDCEIYLEFRGVNSIADVKVNNMHAGHHEGGYSTFRVKITELLKENNIIEVFVDNCANDYVYPQKADFTFYGGIYRDVYLITLSEKNHFNLNNHGGSGFKVTPVMHGGDAEVTLEVEVIGNYDDIRFIVEDVGQVVISGGNQAQGKLLIKDAHLWNGTVDPYLYEAKAELLVNGEVVDVLTTRFGCRSYHFDPEQGFFLNGKSYPIRGVSKHQDFKGLGNAITKEHQDLDMELICEIGANSIRLAHYQHDQYFYDLCDEKGMVVWAEIPYITAHMTGGRENTISQMKELVIQNYNHPSVVCWALSNEIGVAGVTDDLIENHQILNDLAHKLDSTRLTAMADAFMLPTDSPINDIPDILGYNLYFGWYMGELEDNDNFFDEFHKKHPNRCVGMTEYGADTLYQLQSPKPEKGDYSEQYQCVYHEHLLEMFAKRPYIWGTYVWNMFDFGADGRAEAGDNGINHKGLVSIDRKVKKDSFFLYKAWWSGEPFVHLCSKRYMDRVESLTEVKVYSNQSKVALFLDGTMVEEKAGIHVFTFQVEINGKHKVEARSGAYEDAMEIQKVDKANPNYYLESSAVRNWFDEPGMEIIQGYYSVQDRLEDICLVPEGKVLVDQLVEFARASRGEVTKSVKRTPEMERMTYRNTVLGLVKLVGGAITTEMVVDLNKKLIKIKKPQ
ncbi:MAG: glycoside hydrolase family 2 protein [Lachnotalea sp.]